MMPVLQLDFADVHDSITTEPSAESVQIRYAGIKAVECALDTIRAKVGMSLYTKIAECHNPEFAAKVTGMLLDDFCVEDFVRIIGNKDYMLERVRL